ncbi:helix-turn-helix domain-containing protein [Enterobacter mori]|nr:helix-turn-helix domain-containing protein [Enterobacter mori]
MSGTGLLRRRPCKCAIDRSVVLTLHQNGTGATDIARQLSIARSTVYKILSEKE